jgi:hypothetical protein
VNTGSLDEEGRLVLVNGKLVAVLVRLSDEHPQPELHGAWFIEAIFGLISGKGSVFPTYEEAEAWVCQRFEDKEKGRSGQVQAASWPHQSLH